MKVLWAQEALNDRTAIWDYLEERNPLAAAEMDERFSEAAARLAEQPLMGAPGKIAGTRELIPHEHYRLVYELDEEAGIVWIVTLIHTARCWPPVSPES
ncbi:MAG: type II toxin-antitoxin system mRNA interferase toxin, RelE/StbE family [Mixta calida]|uniref:Type II toxin-antitoxin system mRNA interferase toxin, RelE/StbE family n=1 Tax=Mixta calida TaxID=665913 RepID=A0ABM6S128_9GAMM|nr:MULTISPECIES: type II toxin-antitoxin system mRNA interferase toxin, RelE/StbE family [Mixta]AIX73976.1 translation repressor RelE [Pantoea sp. PSNIH2]MBS6057799.1 type II toxin-antitoxin system mRNA interferase toxin, RelE/StbE family [Pantoea sp.]POU42135.1 type II toxin-antitoxin system mRNA interferase toxin, RelE/StbE family [Pantoea sp. PSNIH5]POU61092.1 type II toxin-antitoxin system mRNA interferase toxin, RelE/StbE family [Pantoea sp. PSNIH4]POY66157.1 type II toxin-antitoxin syste